jgi:hypothetical protein
MLDGSRYWTIAVIMQHAPPGILNDPSPQSISSSGSSWGLIGGLAAPLFKGIGRQRRAQIL